MTRRGFYTMALWLPVSWPIIFSFGEFFLHSFTWHQMSRVSGLVLLSGMFGGIQYILFAVLVSFRYARKETEQISRSVWFMPMVFAPICAAGLALFLKVASIQASRMRVRASEVAPIDLFSVTSNIFIFVLIISYTYVFIIKALIAMVERVGLLAIEE